MIDLEQFSDLVALDHGLAVVVTRVMREERRSAVLVTPTRAYSNPP